MFAFLLAQSAVGECRSFDCTFAEYGGSSFNVYSRALGAYQQPYMWPGPSVAESAGDACRVCRFIVEARIGFSVRIVPGPMDSCKRGARARARVEPVDSRTVRASPQATAAYLARLDGRHGLRVLGVEADAALERVGGDVTL